MPSACVSASEQVSLFSIIPSVLAMPGRGTEDCGRHAGERWTAPFPGMAATVRASRTWPGVRQLSVARERGLQSVTRRIALDRDYRYVIPRKPPTDTQLQRGVRSASSVVPAA